MLFVIKNNQLLFKIDSDNPDIYTGEFDSILVGLETDYYDAEKDCLISTINKPRSDYIWIGDRFVQKIENAENNALIFIPQVAFTNFYNDVRNTDVWLLIKDYGSKTLKLNLAVTMLIHAVTTTFSITEFEEYFQDFMDAVGDYHRHLGDVIDDSINKLSLIHLNVIQTLLNQNRIPVTVKVLNDVAS